MRMGISGTRKRQCARILVKTKVRETKKNNRNHLLYIFDVNHKELIVGPFRHYFEGGVDQIAPVSHINMLLDSVDDVL